VGGAPGAAGTLGLGGSGGNPFDAGPDSAPPDSGGPGSVARSWSINASGYAQLWDIATDGTRVIAAATIVGDVTLGGVRASIDGNDFAVVAFDGRGDYAWHRAFDATSVEDVALEADPAGNTYVAGIASSVTFGGDRHGFDADRVMFVAKLAPSGDVLWSKGFRRRLMHQAELAVGLGVDAQGSAWLSGMLSTGEIDFGPEHVLEPSSDSEWYLARLDASGNASWTRRFSGLNSAVLGVDGSGAAFLATNSLNDANLGGPVPACPMTDPCLAIARFDSAGTRTWLVQSAHRPDLTGVAAASGSLLLTAVGTVDFGAGVVGDFNHRIHALLDGNGAFRWARTSTRSAEEWGTVAASGAVYLAGFSGGYNVVGGTPVSDWRERKALYLASYEASGSQRFARFIGGGDQFNDIVGIVATESGPVIGGNYRSSFELDRTLPGTPDLSSIYFVRSAP
jgi:hypothetical protein